MIEPAIVSLAVVGMLTVACGTAVAQQYEVKQSDDFDWKYEMDVLPSEQDLDGNSTMDFTATSGLSIADGILTSGANAYFDSPDGGIWKSSMDFSAGYTIETRLKVVEMTQGDRAWAILAGAPNGTSATFLNVADASQGWNSGSNLGMADNTDDFHVFRVVQSPGAESYTVWRDEQMLATGLPSGYGAGNTCWFGDGSGGWSGTTEVDYLRFTQGAYAPSEPVVLPLEQKASEDFSWNYEMDVSPDTQDLDGNELPDFAFSAETGFTVSGGVLAYDTSVVAEDYLYVSSPAGGLWQGKFNTVEGYTIEMRLKVNAVSGNTGLAMLGSTSDVPSSSFLGVGSAGQGWGGDGNNLDLGAADNSDDFHVFRVAKIPVVDEYRVWRDGQLVADGLTSGYSVDGETFWFGDGNGAIGGDVEIDYIRFINGAYKPESTQLPGDANGDGAVDVSDLGILATHYGGSGKTWEEGDFNGDGVVDVSDLGVLATNYGTSAHAAVPEPATATMMLVAGLMLAVLIRSKR